jgi:hypothetical protein
MEAMGGDLNDDCSDLAALDAGDSEAGRRLYDRHAPLLFALCREEVDPARGKTQRTPCRRPSCAPSACASV